MSDSKLGKEILGILEDAGPHIEVGAALVGLLTEYVKLINEKVPLNDLLVEVGKFLKSEIIPAVEGVEAECFRLRNKAAEGWGEVYVTALKKVRDYPGADTAALEITLQMMRGSQDTFKTMSNKQLVSVSSDKK